MNPLAKAADAEVSRRRAEELVSWLRGYAAERINSRLMDERRCVTPNIILDFGNRGLLGMQAAEAYGGLGLRHADYLRVLEQLAAIDLTLTVIVFTHAVLGTRPIQRHATPALCEEIIPRLASGRELASFGLSEPGAGSNVGGIMGRATPDGQGGWRIRAVKRWNSSAWAGVISVFVRLVDERGRLGGMTGFVVRQGAPGVRIGPEALTMGLRASIQNSIYFNDVEAKPEQLLGELGRGMEIAEDVLMVGRLGISAACVGGLKRCAQLMARYGGRRAVATGRLVENPVVLATLGEIAALIDAVGALKDQIAGRLDAGLPVPAEAAMAAKVIGSDGLNWAAGQLMQFLGGRGYMENNLAPQLLRDARLLSIGEGPNEPLTTQVGRKARHTSAIAEYLASEPQGADLASTLTAAAAEIAERCLSGSGPFDRSTAQVWAETLIGRVASEAMLLAALRSAHHRAPDARLGRSLAWTEARFARTLQRAREGYAEDALIPNAGEIQALVGRYAEAIGDIEQGLAGADEEIDPFLRKQPAADPLPTDLPGLVAVPDDEGSVPPGAGEAPADQSVQAKRELLAQLLRRRLEGAPAAGLTER
jgi:alkylation response protein AidB-like acyl-CoA dehydrogenase